MQEFGPFRLHRSLGATPLGASFLAETPWEATPFCVVEIHSVPLEARDVGPKHPNIVDRLAMGSIGGRSYLAKELVLGKNVARILPRIRALRRPTPPSIAVRLWADLLTALAWLHERRPHGAVSPENVIVAYAGVAKLELVEGAGGSIEADLFGAASAVMRMLGRALPSPLDLLLADMLASDVARRPQTARAALERLLAGTSAVEPAPRGVVGQWLSDLFSGEKAEELAELAALRSNQATDEGLPWFNDEVSTSEFNTEILEPEQTFGGDETVQLIEAGATDRSPAPLPDPAKPRDAKVPTLVLDSEPSSPTIPPRLADAGHETFGPYRLLGKIGEGGMAEVMIAESDKGRCVIKRIAPTLRIDADFAEMFQEEARIARLLEHPNIVACLDSGAIDGVLYIAFELIEGVDLAKLIIDISPEKVPPSAALEMAAALARALDYAHRLTEDGRPLQVVHRDVSPENIVISWSGEVKLLDFGISRFRDRSFATRAGVLKGKIGYMAPEQLAVGIVGEQTDIYQLGVVLAEAMSGQRLFPGDLMVRPKEMAEMRALLARHLIGVAPKVIDLVARLCAPEPAMRPQSAKQALAEIEELRSKIGEGKSLRALVRSRAPTGTLPSERTKVTGRGIIPAVAIGLLLVTATVAAIVYRWLTS